MQLWLNVYGNETVEGKQRRMILIAWLIESKLYHLKMLEDRITSLQIEVGQLDYMKDSISGAEKMDKSKSLKDEIKKTEDMKKVKRLQFIDCIRNLI